MWRSWSGRTDPAPSAPSGAPPPKPTIELSDLGEDMLAATMVLSNLGEDMLAATMVLSNLEED